MKYTKSLLCACVLLFGSTAVGAKTWLVGPTRNYTAPSKVMTLVADGDTVLIDADTYSGDVGEWTNNNLTIIAVGGRAHLDANGKIAQQKGIWVVSGNNTSITGIEFSGAAISQANGNNGAGIRQQGNNLTLRNCYFHDNQDGILGGGDATSNVDIEACEFGSNGAGDGFSHNMYIGSIHSFTLKFCYVHEAKVGHNVKTRAANNFIAYNRIVDGENGTASYSIDIPNGGRSVVLGNAIMKGPKAQNHIVVRYGEEGLSNPDSELFVINNTMVSENASAVFVSIQVGAAPAKITNNIFAGTGTVFSGSADSSFNAVSKDTSLFKFRNSTPFDYHLTLASPELQGTSNTAPTGSHLPVFQYEHPLDSSLRLRFVPSIGAYDRPISQGVASVIAHNTMLTNYPNPFERSTTIQLPREESKVFSLQVCDVAGQPVISEDVRAIDGKIVFDGRGLSSSTYFYRIDGPSNSYRGRFVIR